MAKLKKKKRSVDPSEEFLRKLKQLSSGLIHMAATLDFQYRSSGSLFDLENGGLTENGANETIAKLAHVSELIRGAPLFLHDSGTHKINPDAAERIRDMEIPT